MVFQIEFLDGPWLIRPSMTDEMIVQFLSGLRTPLIRLFSDAGTNPELDSVFGVYPADR